MLITEIKRYIMTHSELLQVAKAFRDWIDAIPKDIELPAMPAMPGVDRDWADTVISQAELKADTEWNDITNPPKIQNTNKPWNESKRVVVLMKHHGNIYEAFARYTHSEVTGYEWMIEGHGGNWSDRVIGWLPLPPHTR